MNRSDLLQLIEAALAAQQPAYVRQVAQCYLKEWPGDLGMQLALARTHAAEGLRPALAVETLEALVAADPEDFRAQRLLAGQAHALGKHDVAQLAYASAHVGDGLKVPEGYALSDWAKAARVAYLADRMGDYETAQRETELILGADTASPLPSLLHLCSLWHAGQFDLALPLAEGFHARWPLVVAFKLCLAECLLKSGDRRARALQLLHDAAGQDLAGQVAHRHWGDSHPYAMLWESNLSAPLPGPLPAELIAALGLNRLPGTKAQASTPPKIQAAVPRTSEEVADIQSQLASLAARLLPKQSDFRLQTSDFHYLILSSRTRLIQAFGADGFAAVDTLITTLALNVSGTRPKPNMRATILYLDDPTSLRPFGLKPVNPSNAWEIKNLLAELSIHFKEKGRAIGALLIVGGADIVPFHHLPNPTDDSDPDIPSDNPYATADENYFVPEWPVGRIPSGAGKNSDPLLRALRIAADHHARQAKLSSESGLRRIWRRLTSFWLKALSGKRGQILPSFGYSANVWKQASAAVYNAIGDPRTLLTSPPLDANALPVDGLTPSRLSYFNLHGIEDGPEWYGQRSADDHTATSEYPVALRPADVSNHGRAPAIVFSEACFGANILGKTTQDALCLRFLDSGSRALVASTKIAYGSVTTPLIGADLLGRYFWQNAAGVGLPVGEALRRAKLQMAQEMHNRQGFLDGEDQKTLIEFVLYGDPLATAPYGGYAKRAKSEVRTAPRLWNTTLPIVCDKTNGETELSAETVARIKSVVARYLPGMQDAQWHVAHAHAHCTAKHKCPTAHLAAGAKNISTLRSDPHTTVVTLSKTLHVNARAHPHYARVTLNEKGALVKLAVSR